MAEYIDREEAKAWIADWLRNDKYWNPYSRGKNIPTTEVFDVLTRIPAADVQPVLEYGGWTAEGNDEYGNYWDECTACRKAVWFPPFVKNDYKYCPHCGARMDGE